ncbi:hypothetical protein ScalyP_jg8245 [Parmales sp. scaly parma]|nr:hypothetical protein ScalyP_jg8245 [Parmales sp. scaly parma]
MLSKYINIRQCFDLIDVRVTLTAGNKIQIETKLKSFKVTPLSIRETADWANDLLSSIDKARISSNLPPTYAASLFFAPMWEENTLSCEECSRSFTIVVRRHHCRRCGKCLCGTCCFEKVRLDEIDENKLHKVCSPCASDVKSKRTRGTGGYGAAPVIGRTQSDKSM